MLVGRSPPPCAFQASHAGIRYFRRALYLLLVVVTRNTELTVIKQTYARTGIECIAMMLLIGTLLNAQLRAEHGLDDFVSESNRVPLEPSAG